MFRFEFQTILDQRQALEERRQIELAEAMEVLKGERERLFHLRREREEMVAQYYRLSGKAVPGIMPALISEAIRLKREEELKQEGICKKWEREVEIRRQALIEASRQKKIMERLKEKKLAEYLEEAKQKEIKELDEAAILRYEGERE
ncbi:MAG: flagellar export protein FliJ [Syntrophales bacterium]|nr:flagellar export protein FliJ [Syntrophales bacterium]